MAKRGPLFFVAIETKGDALLLFPLFLFLFFWGRGRGENGETARAFSVSRRPRRRHVGMGGGIIITRGQSATSRRAARRVPASTARWAHIQTGPRVG